MLASTGGPLGHHVAWVFWWYLYQKQLWEIIWRRNGISWLLVSNLYCKKKDIHESWLKFRYQVLTLISLWTPRDIFNWLANILFFFYLKVIFTKKRASERTVNRSCLKTTSQCPMKLLSCFPEIKKKWLDNSQNREIFAGELLLVIWQKSFLQYHTNNEFMIKTCKQLVFIGT